MKTQRNVLLQKSGNNKQSVKKITAILSAAMIAVSAVPAALASSPFMIMADTTYTVVKLDPSNASPFNNGEFQGWGTSLCWWANRVGYSEKMTKQAADLFFSDEGLSLDIARYNLGGGDDAAHNHITRSDSKIPGYATGYDKDGNIVYDWTADENQRNIALAAKKANPDIYFEGFSNSPPYFMTNSGCSGGAVNSNNDNLRTDDINNFGRFIAETTKHFKDEFGIEFKSYSPMNEPDTDYWGYLSWKQEGCHYTPGDMQSKTIIAARNALDSAGLNDVLVVGMDETNLDKTITNYGKLSAEAKTALGRIDTHTYGGTKRAELKSTAVAADKDLWMSEVDGGYDGFGLANHIITDMNGMMPAAWVMWDIVDVHRDSSFQAPDGSYPEKDVTLNVAGTLWGVGMANHDEENIELSNKYYAYGQFTKYIEPGDTIIASSSSTLAAYNKKSGDIKIVALNSGSADKPYKFDLSAFTNVGNAVKTIRSNNETEDKAEHWAEIENGAEISDKIVTATLKARTITTYVISGAGETGYAVITGGKGKLRPGMSINLALATTLEDNVTWSVSDSSVADIKADGTVTAKAAGDFTVYADIGETTVSRDFIVSEYGLYGTPSWSNSSSPPSDDADYTKAADGKLDTYFDGVGGGWVMYDFYTPYKADTIRLAPRSGFAARTAGAKIQGSSDAISWTDIYTLTSALIDNTYTDITSDKFDDNGAYRYYRYINSAEMTNIAEFQIIGSAAEPAAGEPVVRDIYEFTDDFESSDNIFGANYGFLSDNGNTVFPSGLARFGNVFSPIGSTARAELAKPLTLSKNDRFRLSYNMFSGWENKGKYNVFFIKDDKDNELVAIRLSGGGYTLDQVRIGGTNVLENTSVAQCRSNPSGSKQGANGWDSDQPYRNYVGYNKTVEITIDGTGTVSIDMTGGMQDTHISGALDGDITIGTLQINGEYNSSRARTAAYDNFEASVISYPHELPEPERPAPTPKPELPNSGELIHLDFNDTIDSFSPYGKAEPLGTPVFETVDDRTCLKLDGTNNTVLKLTDANGNPLLTGQNNLTITFKVKPTTTSTSWWAYAAPDNNGQNYNKEKYLGVLGGNGTISVERYNNNGSRSTAASGAYKINEWNDVMISVNDGMTSIFVNGKLAGSAASKVDITDMLGSKSIFYIGKANWNGGEYANGYLDDFVIYNYALPLIDISQDGSEISYTTGYKESMPFDMYIALKDSDGVLRDVHKNAESGSFTAGEGNYTVTQYLWKGTKPMTEPIEKKASDGAYLFVHFIGTESNANQEQIYFSVSRDGASWKTLNGGMPVLTSTLGEKGVRDPFIQRGIDGKYYIIATDLSIYNRRDDPNRWGACQTSGSQSIVIWESDDLINWSEGSLVKVADDKAGCTWAPESIYDPEKEAYMVFWASKVSDDNYTKQRIYRSYTKDFKTFTPAEVYIDNPTSAIDTTILENDGVYYRFTKDETYSSVTMMKSTSLSQGWEDVGSYTINGYAGNKVTGYEGPTIYKLNGENRWCLLLDYFSKSQGYKPFVTDDITKGNFTSATDFIFDATYRHGTVMPITTAEYMSLVDKYGN